MITTKITETKTKLQNHYGGKSWKKIENPVI